MMKIEGAESIGDPLLSRAWVNAGSPSNVYVSGPKRNVLECERIEEWLRIGDELVALGCRLLSPGGMALKMGVSRQAVHERIWSWGSLSALYGPDAFVLIIDKTSLDRVNVKGDNGDRATAAPGLAGRGVPR